MQNMRNFFLRKQQPDCLKCVLILIGYNYVDAGEKLKCIHEVVGSIPISSTKNIKGISQLD